MAGNNKVMCWSMNTQTIQSLSAEAMNELRAIVKKEIKEPMTDAEIEEMGISLLRMFALVIDPEWIRIACPICKSIIINEITKEKLPYRFRPVAGLFHYQPDFDLR